MTVHRFLTALVLTGAACAVPERPDAARETHHARGVRIIQQTCDADAECPATYACQHAVANGTTVSYCISDGPGPGGGSCPDGLVLVHTDDTPACAAPCRDDDDCVDGFDCRVADDDITTTCQPHG